jgi:cell division protease FtsH
VLLGGRAAEEIIYGDISTGAAHDLGRATEIARQMVMDHGMNDRFRHTALRSGPGGRAVPGMEGMPMSREIAEATQQYVDERIAALLSRSYERAQSLLSGRTDLLRRVAGRLLEKESLSAREFKDLIREDAESPAARGAAKGGHHG